MIVVEADLGQDVNHDLYDQAAISRRKEKLTSTVEVDNSNGVADGDANENTDGTGAFVSGEIHEHEHEEDAGIDTSREAGGELCSSRKRTKISASGSWREGSNDAHSGQQDMVEGTTSPTTAFSSSGTVNIAANPTGRSRPDVPPYAPLLSSAQVSASFPFSTPSKPNPRVNSITKEHSNDSTSFAIYEDSGDNDLQAFTLGLGLGLGVLEFGLGYGYGFGFGLPLPDSWYSGPEDNKENAEDGLHDVDMRTNDEGAGVGTGVWGGGNGADGGMNWDVNDEDANTVAVEGFRGEQRLRRRHHNHGHQDLADMRRHHHLRTVQRMGLLDAGGMDMDVNVEIRPVNEERGPDMQMHTENRDRGQHQQHQDTDLREAPTAEINQESEGQVSPSLLGAPPRRFWGRGASRRAVSRV